MQSTDFFYMREWQKETIQERNENFCNKVSASTNFLF